MMHDDVVIQGTREGVLVRFAEGRDFRVLKQRLRETLEARAPFFDGGEVVLDLSRRRLTQRQTRELVDLITRRYGLRVARVRSPESARSPFPSDTFQDLLRQETQTVWVKKTLRSGQHVHYNGTIIVLGDVNPGAEVVATGDIIVLGALRGVAHAGATGNVTAVVAAFRLEPVQLRIGTLISRSPDGERTRTHVPEVARIREGLVVIDQYVSKGFASM